jgi:hypothetical protein
VWNQASHLLESTSCMLKTTYSKLAITSLSSNSYLYFTQSLIKIF